MEPQNDSGAQIQSQADEQLIIRADKYIADERLLKASKCLNKLENPDFHLQPKHRAALKRARLIEEAIQNHLSPPDHEWKKQAESNGTFDSVIYYKTEDGRLTCRIETPIESSLLVPLLSVLNESELYTTWMPYYTFPFHIGLKSNEKLRQVGRCGQISRVVMQMPWPITNRELVYEVWVSDEIEEQGVVVVKGTSKLVEETGDVETNTPAEGLKAMNFETEFLFRKCPLDHVSLSNSKRNYPQDQHLILVSITLYADCHLSFVPKSFDNFVCRTFIGGLWSSTLQVAEDVKEGKRPQHVEAIAARKKTYEWVEGRIQIMFQKLDEDNDK